MFKSETPILGENGTTAKLINTHIAPITGARTKTNRSLKGGIQSSLPRIFSKSANDCKTPKGPTRFGPQRSCQIPIILRSTQTNIAAMGINKAIMMVISNTFHSISSIIQSSRAQSNRDSLILGF